MYFYMPTQDQSEKNRHENSPFKLRSLIIFILCFLVISVVVFNVFTICARCGLSSFIYVHWTPEWVFHFICILPTEAMVSEGDARRSFLFYLFFVMATTLALKTLKPRE